MKSAKTGIKNGAIFWIYNIQYFFVQIIAASAWHGHFSWARNTISDLGNTHCGDYNGAVVCSPRHTLMNVSFVLLGITMIGGAFYLYGQFQKNRFVAAGFGCMALGGIGTMLVGLFPENSISSLHILGAALPFIFGNIGMVLIGKYCLDFPAWLRRYSILSGVIGFAALGLYVGHAYLGLGIGTIERLTAYPQTIWMMVTGLFLLVLQDRKDVA